MAKTEGNGAAKPFVLPANRRVFFESVCNVHRLIVPTDTTKEAIEHRDFLSASRDKFGAADVAHIYDESFRTYWQAIAIGAPGDGIIGGDVRLVVLMGPVKLPEISGGADRDLPLGYTLPFNPKTRRFEPFHGDKPLSTDGFPIRDDARRVIMQHAKTVSVVPR